MTPLYDIVIIGSGFGGSLLAMIARRAGRSVLLLEKGTHPRFAIGESTTPLSNLLLEELAVRHDLPRLKPLTQWGTWQESHPELAAGLKRGFTFYHHSPNASPFDRDRQLLVAASPNDYLSDTHWYRADVDHFFLREAVALGVDYLDRVSLSRMIEAPDGVTLEGARADEPVAFRCRFLIDATGPRGFIHRALGLPEATFPNLPPTQALFTHFSDVAPFAPPSPEIPPYPPDTAALHHIFDGGWIWVLRFNNGLTSAGAAVRDPLADRLHLSQGSPAWTRLLDLLPAVRDQFASAQPALPFIHSPRLSFLTGAVTGQRWALLPSAAAFVDPLLSTGFPLTLFGIQRLAKILTEDWDSPHFQPSLDAYAAQTTKEALAAARLIAALYATMDNFPLFTALTMLYFAAASFAETVRRLNKPHLASSFLLCDDPVFGPASARLCEQALHVRTIAESDQLRTAILTAIEPFNVAGLGAPHRSNWYPVDPTDLLHAAPKLGETPASMRQFLKRSGFPLD